MPVQSSIDPGILREIEEIAKEYHDNLYGYRRDILKRDHEDWQQEVGLDIQRFKRNAISSGHGIGKTGFFADIIHWFIATRPRPAVVATAGTENQLRTKLWRELLRVNNDALNSEHMRWKASTFSMLGDETQQANAIPWSEDNPQAFAGTHEDHVLGVFDEGSAIARNIYNTFQGAMSTPGARWVVAGNPHLSEGYFYDITHGKLAGRRPIDWERGKWKSHIIDCFKSTRVDASYPEEVKEEHGEESDEYRIRVLGLPPRQSAQQFIAESVLNQAKEREIEMFERWPLIIGCDVGKGDRSVMFPRRGRIGLPFKVFNGLRTMDFAREIRMEIEFWRAEFGLEAQCVIEDLGVGVGVIERLEDWGFEANVHGVHTGEQATQPELYTNIRCEMWGELKAWLEEPVMLPNDAAMTDDLLNIRKKPSSTGKLKLETKEEMRKRGLKSPDIGDALALTFVYPFDLLPEKSDAYKHDDWQSQSASSETDWMGA